FATLLVYDFQSQESCGLRHNTRKTQGFSTKNCDIQRRGFLTLNNHATYTRTVETAYDSVTCQQQKCHLHLIRNINDDLLHKPFDEELKELARRYTLTLKPMVETIDKHGLKTKFLSKHKRNAEAFLDWIGKR